MYQLHSAKLPVKAGIPVDFSITQADKLIARIEKAWPAFQDRYRLEILEEKDELTALCVVLAIDVEAERHN